MSIARLLLILAVAQVAFCSEVMDPKEFLFENEHLNGLRKPSSSETEIDCVVRKTAYDYAKSIITDRGELTEVYKSLSLFECDVPPPKTVDPRVTVPESMWIKSDDAIFVDFYHGDDKKNTGTIDSPFKTIQRGIVQSRSLPSTKQKIVYVREGEYFIEKPIQLLPIDSNLLLSAYQDEVVILTGSKTIEVDWNEYKVNQFELFMNKNIGYDIHSPIGKKDPGDSIPGKMIFLNKTNTYQECQELCASDAQCNAYLWHDDKVTGGWSNMCYSIVDNENVLVSEEHHISGIRQNIYKADLSSFHLPAFSQLYAEDRRLILARYPNANVDYQGVHTDPSGYLDSNLAHWDAVKSFPDALEYHFDTPTRTNGTYTSYSLGEYGPGSQWNPPTSYWAQKHPVGGGGCTYKIPTGVTIDQKKLSGRQYKNPIHSRLHAFHSGYWGNWMFDIDKYKYDNSTHNVHLHWNYGGFQEARGSGSGGKFFIENVFEELDSPDEWFYDVNTQELFLYPNGTINRYRYIQVPYTKTLFDIRGYNNVPITNVAIRGFVFRNTDSTYMDDYEVPSGGDIAVHRGGAIHIQQSKNVTVAYNRFRNIGSSAICLSGYNSESTVSHNEISLIGDNGILLLGDTDLLDATGNKHNEYIHIENNLIFNIGLYMKQSSPIMMARTAASIVHNNILFNCPRAGININDGLGGGHEIFQNLIYNTVRETGDHGNINTWDRMPFVTLYKEGTSPSIYPKINHVHHNYLIGNYNSLWPIDHDDGSCYWHDYENVLAYGGWKNFLGHSKTAADNLYVYPDSSIATGVTPYCAVSHGASLGQSGFNEKWYHNECIINNKAVYSITNCKDLEHIKELTFDTSSNTIYTNHPLEEIQIQCSVGSSMNYTDYQKLGFDRESTIKSLPSLSDLEAMMRAKLNI